jgi:ABC-type protease/lipase transport system fused ATPase/permease subunit
MNQPKNQTILVKLAIIISGGSGRMVVGSAVYAIQNLIATFRQLRQKIGDRIMKAALYARVSTDDKGQNPQVQLDQLRQFCKDAGWEIFQEYVDYASACDFMKEKRGPG